MIVLAGQVTLFGIGLRLMIMSTEVKLGAICLQEAIV